MKKRIGSGICLCGLCLLLAAGCSGAGKTDPQDGQKEENGQEITVPGPGCYDSEDTALITRISEEEKKITFLNLEIGRRYTLSYDGATVITDKYGEAASVGQMREGDLADIRFLRGAKTLTEMKAADGFSQSDISRFEIDPVRKELSVGEDVYRISDNTVVFSEGREIDFTDINACDTLSVSGIDGDVYGIVVEKGHGYLQLANDEKFIGGFIEVGQSVITEIKKDMLLTVPEGSYQVQISYQGGGGTKSVVINRDEEVTLDIGDLTVPEPKYGKVLFTLSPEDLVLYIDGEETDVTGGVELSYGIHQMYARADGYSTVSSYLKIGKELTALDVVLEPIENQKEDPSSSGGDVSGNRGTEPGTGGNSPDGKFQVHVEVSGGAEVYLDGNYIGLAPAAFEKVPGSHVITLRKTGCETRSYTVQIDGDRKDVNYVFAELEKAGEKSGVPEDPENSTGEEEKNE